METVASMEAYNRFFRQDTAHPQVAIGELSRADLSLFEPLDFGMYCVILMDAAFGELVKCGEAVSYRAGTVFWLRPGQEVSMNLDYRVRPRGWMLAFRPELLEKSGLGRDFYMFDFFNHDVNEALELNQTERGVLLNCYANIQAELYSARDNLSNHMLHLGISQLLSYCKRYFERQYKPRVSARGASLREHIEQCVDNYLSSGMPSQQGQCTVAWCASQFNLSANYFGDLVRRETHSTPKEIIQDRLIGASTRLLATTSLTVNEIAERLGFFYPTHFTRLFRRRTGLTPRQYRERAHGGGTAGA